MSTKLPDMLGATLEKLKNMVDVNTVVGSPINTPDGITIIPVSRISVGYGGGGSDAGEHLGGGIGGGVKVTPICFLVIKEGNVRLLSIPQPANNVADRIVDMIPDTLDRVSGFVDSLSSKKE